MSWSNFMFLSNHPRRFDQSLIKALDLTGHSQTFRPPSEVKQSLGQERLNYSFEVLSDLWIRMPTNEHVTLCQFGNWIRCNWTHYCTVIHPCHCSIIKVRAWPIVYDFINPVLSKPYVNCYFCSISQRGQWWQTQALFLSGRVHPSSLCSPQSNPAIPAVCLQQSSPWRLKHFLAPVERRSMYCTCASMYESLLGTFYHFIMKWKQHVCEIRWVKNAAQYLGIILCDLLSFFVFMVRAVGNSFNCAFYFFHTELWLTLLLSTDFYSLWLHLYKQLI